MHDIKVAFVKDPHFRFGFKRPVGRTDSFFQDISDKVDWLVSFCKDSGIKTVCVAGDLFDKGRPSDYTLPVLRSMSSILSRFKESGITLVVIQGNHDMPTGGYNSSDLGMSVIRHFEEAGLLVDVSFKPLDFSSMGFKYHKLGSGVDISHVVCVSGIGYCGSDSDFRANVERYNRGIYTYNFSCPLDYVKHITLLHQHVLPDGMDFPWEFNYSYSEIAELFPHSSVIFAGHNHSGFGDNFYQWYTRKDGSKVLFVSPTAFTRLARSSSILNGEQDPSVVVVNFRDTVFVDDQMGVDSHMVDCRSAKDVFLVDEFKVETQFKSDLMEFNSMVKSFSEGSQMDSLSASDDIKDVVQDYLDRADSMID